MELRSFNRSLQYENYHPHNGISILITIISLKNARRKDKNQQSPGNRCNLGISLIPSVENKAYKAILPRVT